MDNLIKTTKEKMQRRIEHLETEYASIRAGRANPGVLDKVTVDYYGTPTPVNQVANVSITEARTLVVQPWDASLLKALERAIQMSEIGINPQNDGKVIRLIFPPLTEERRKDIVKDVSKMAEDTKVQIRNARREANEKIKAMKKSGEITEDDQKSGDKKIQDITDKAIKEVESISAAKQKEIMAI
ncbi:MAG: ribosome recycling factor [Oscillospiraceae bacterium]|nr:ribosome recycling factor [Oscillospiraceae bacterium]